MNQKYTFWEVLGPLWPVIVIAYGIAVMATPVWRFIAYRKGVMDKPDALLKTHGRVVAYLGGLGVWTGFIATIIGAGAYFQLPWMLIGTIGLSCTIIMLTGLLDDLVDLSPKKKMAGQAVSAIILYGGLWLWYSVEGRLFAPAANFYEPFGLELPAWIDVGLSFVFSIVLVVATCNATNLLDGLDGLCGGVTGIIALAFAVMAVLLATYDHFPYGTDKLRVVLSLAMAGAVLGFLPYNIPPASIFLGDAGSMLLGFFVAVMMMLFSVEGHPRFFLAACVIFGLPILDTGLAVVRRAVSGVSIFAGDRSHLYDQLVDRGMSVKQVVGLFYLLAVVAAALGIFQAHYLQAHWALLLDIGILLLFSIIVVRAGMVRPVHKK